MKLKLTINELAARLNVDYASARALIKIMIEKGTCTKIDSISSPTGKGKPSAIYELDDVIVLTL